MNERTNESALGRFFKNKMAATPVDVGDEEPRDVRGPGVRVGGRTGETRRETAAAVDGTEEDHRRAVLRLDLQNKRPGGPDHADQWRSTLIPTRDMR